MIQHDQNQSTEQQPPTPAGRAAMDEDAVLNHERSGRPHRENGGQVGQEIGRSAQLGKDQLASRMASLAEHLRQSSSSLSQDEAWLAGLVDRGAGTLDHYADQLRLQSWSGLLASMREFASREPALFVGATVAAGFAAARLAMNAGAPGAQHSESNQPGDALSRNAARETDASPEMDSGGAQSTSDLASHGGPIDGGYPAGTGLADVPIKPVGGAP